MAKRLTDEEKRRRDDQRKSERELRAYERKVARAEMCKALMGRYPDPIPYVQPSKAVLVQALRPPVTIR